MLKFYVYVTPSAGIIILYRNLRQAPLQFNKLVQNKKK